MNNEIKDFLIKLTKEYKFAYCRRLRKRYQDKIKIIEDKTYFLDKNCKLTERVYCILNDIFYRKICPTCKDVPVKFKKDSSGYFDHCSTRCSQKDENVRKKYEKTYEEKYGIKVDCNFKLPGYYENQRKKLKEKYGVINVSQLNYVKDKKRKTFQKNNKIPHPSWGNTWYNIKLPSGRNVKVQGYERFAIKFLLKKYNENDLLISNKDINNKTGDFLYTKNNKIYRYYPDFYIISENKVIEIKSLFTLKNHIKTTKLKALSCKDKNINYELWVMNYKGNIINDQPEVKKIFNKFFD